MTQCLTRSIFRHRGSHLGIPIPALFRVHNCGLRMARVLAAIGLHELVHEVCGRGNHHLELQGAPGPTGHWKALELLELEEIWMASNWKGHGWKPMGSWKQI